MKKLYVHAYLVGNLGDDLMVAAVLFWGSVGSSQFIYFQF